MKVKFKYLAMFLFQILGAASVHAAAGTSGGLTLLETNSARSSALGEAFTASLDDVAGFGYNPAALNSLKTGQASFLYQKGLAEDAYGHFMIGAPSKNGGLGLSVGYYNGGSIDLYDGVTERTVTAQRDLTMALGMARNIGRVSFGFTGKYISSELIESAKATAYAADFGLSLPVTSRIQLGAAVQNIGTELKFIEEGDSLPRIARLGTSAMLSQGAYPVTLMLDAPYYMNEQELRPAVGLEINVGPLALRGGYKTGSGSNELSVGTGFIMGRSSLDYSFGLADKLDSQHRISLSMKFGNGRATPDFVKKPVEPKQREVVKQEVEEQKALPVVFEKPAGAYTLGATDKAAPVSKSRRVYIVKPGDTLAKIAQKEYGSSKQWGRIFSANKHLLEDPEAVEPGQKIVLP